MKRALLFISLLFSCLQVFAQAPAITFFSPLSGPAGTSVTISGSNFSSTTTGNVVFFGAVKAQVTAASANSLTVTVPLGATYKPITVTTNGLKAYSAKPFIITYSDGFSMFDVDSSFAPAVHLPVNASAGSGYVSSADFDGDSKPDLAIISLGPFNSAGNTYIFKNTGSKTSPFTSTANVILNGSGSCMVIDDIDGDGKPDIVEVGYQGGLVIYKNTSTPGSISFAAPITYTTATTFVYVVTSGDIDGDGKPDIAFEGGQPSGVAVFRNTSSGGVISFAAEQDFPVAGNPYGIAIGDIDGDGKVDISTNNQDGGTVSVLRNTSATGSISFDTPKYFTGDGSPWSISAADMDGDGKLDLITTSHPYFGEIKTGAVLRNTSTPGNVSFAPKVNFYTDTWAIISNIADMDGDGKPDIVIVDKDTNQGTLIRNTSIPGAFTFDAKREKTFGTGTNTYGLYIGDLNGDGKPDALIANVNTSYASLLLNSVNPLTPVITNIDPPLDGVGKTVTITGAHLDSVTSVTFGSFPAASFTKVTPAKLTAVIGGGDPGLVSLNSPNGTGTYDSFKFAYGPGISSAAKSASGPNTQVVIKGLYFTGTSSLLFDGVAAISYTVNSDNQVTALIAASSFKTIIMTTPGGSYTYTVPLPPAITSISPAAAPAGATVTITGTGFTGATYVSFGSILAASFTVNSPTSITAVIGSGGRGNVSVTTPAGVGTFSGFLFQFIPTMTSFSPTTGAPGSTITITGTNLRDVSGVSFGGTPARSFTVNTVNSITAFVAEGASGPVTVTTLSGTASLPGFVFDTKPKVYVSGPTTFPVGGHVDLSTPLQNTYFYTWNKDGVPIYNTTAPGYRATQSGSYTVTVTDRVFTNTSDPVVVNAVYTLPADNFTVSATSATCKGQGDGIINITAAQLLNYTATVTAANVNKSTQFTTNGSVTGLAAGTYSVCLTVDGQPDYQQCFTIVITEPKDLSLYSTVNKTENSVTLELSGGQHYNITLNDKNYTTDNSTITLPLSKNSNDLTVTTDRLCQGIIQRTIDISGNKAPYPNWFENKLNVNLGDATVNDGYIRIYSANDGKLVFSQKVANQSGVLPLDLTNLNYGVYSLVLTEGGSKSIFKIVKK